VGLSKPASRWANPDDGGHHRHHLWFAEAQAVRAGFHSGWPGHLGEGGHIRSEPGAAGLRVAQTLIGFSPTALFGPFSRSSLGKPAHLARSRRITACTARHAAPSPHLIVAAPTHLRSGQVHIGVDLAQERQEFAAPVPGMQRSDDRAAGIRAPRTSWRCRSAR